MSSSSSIIDIAKDRLTGAIGYITGGEDPEDIEAGVKAVPDCPDEAIPRPNFLAICSLPSDKLG